MHEVGKEVSTVRLPTNQPQPHCWGQITRHKCSAGIFPVVKGQGQVPSEAYQARPSLLGCEVRVQMI